MDIGHGFSIATAYRVILQQIYATLYLMPVGMYRLCVQLRSCFTRHRIQRFLPKVKIDFIHNINASKYLQYARDDYIRFGEKYDCWLLNQEEWTVVPSVCFVKVKVMQFMVCKDHNKGSTSAYICPLRQPNHILPCKYSDQICYHKNIRTHFKCKGNEATSMELIHAVSRSIENSS